MTKLPDVKRMFGKKEKVGEVRHLIGTVFGWGGLPDYEAICLVVLAAIFRHRGVR